jgi:phospholipase D1/2
VRHSRPAWAKLAPLAIVIAALFLAWRYTPLAELVTTEHVMAWARAVDDLWWSPLVVVAAYIPAGFIMFPRPLITLFAVIAYGPWLGFATSMSGIVLAALCTYFAGRALPGDTLRDLAGDKLERTTKALRGRSFVAALALSVVPVAPFPVVGMMAGAAGIGLWQYLAGTALGMVPGTLATTVFADQVRNALEDPSKINYWLVAGILVLLIALALIVRRWLAKVQRQV